MTNDIKKFGDIVDKHLTRLNESSEVREKDTITIGYKALEDLVTEKYGSGIVDAMSFDYDTLDKLGITLYDEDNAEEDIDASDFWEENDWARDELANHLRKHINKFFIQKKIPMKVTSASLSGDPFNDADYEDNDWKFTVEIEK